MSIFQLGTLQLELGTLPAGYSPTPSKLAGVTINIASTQPQAGTTTNTQPL